MHDFSGADLQGSLFERADLSNSEFRTVDLRGARFRAVDMSRVVMRSVDLVDVEIDGEIENLWIKRAILGDPPHAPRSRSCSSCAATGCLPSAASSMA